MENNSKELTGKTTNGAIGELGMEALESIYILIVPSAGKSASKPKRLVTLTSEEFLTAFQHLLGVPEKETSLVKKDKVDSVKTQSSVAQTVGKCSTSTQTSDAELQYPENGWEANCNGSEKMLADNGHRCAEKERKPVAAEAKCTASISLSLSKANARNEIMEQNLKKVNLANKNSSERNAGTAPSLSENDLLKALRATSPHLRNLYVERFLPDWNVTDDLSTLSSVRYLQAHINMFSEFLESPKIISAVRVKLLKRYGCHLKRLISLFCESDDTRSTIMFDQAVLSHMRKIGGWNFIRAWAHTEVSKKENNSLKGNLPIQLHGKGNVKTCWPTYQTFDKAKRSKKTFATSSRKAPLRLERKSASGRLYLNVRDDNSIDDETERKPATCERQVMRVFRKDTSPSFSSLAKRPRRDNLLDSALNEASPGCSSLPDFEVISTAKFRNSDAPLKCYCKYFNSGYCFKVNNCPFLHLCNICGSASHGRNNCPDASEI